MTSSVPDSFLLSEEDQANFIKEMEALFLDAKEEAKKFTPKKYL